jgi:hypothetical protein
MGCHVAQERPCSPPMKFTINMVDCHPKAHSWMEGGHKILQRKGGQLPHARLMEASMINCRRVMLGMGGSKVVMSTPRLTTQLSHGIHHFASMLCLLSLLGNLVLFQSVLFGLIRIFILPPISTMPRERGNPRRGSAWYSRATRQRCLHNLERDLSIVWT